MVAVAGFYLVFAIARVTPGFVFNMGRWSAPDEQTRRLSLVRGGLRVPSADVREYQLLVALVRRHALGEFIYAGPDAPEVYFLSNLRNPTRSLFDFFNVANGESQQLLRTLTSRQVAVVVVNNAPAFSPPLNGALRDSLAARYRDSLAIGRFLVRWR
jgi:hypothetical protein